MANSFKVVIAIFFMVSWSTKAKAQSTASASATVNIVTPISIVKTGTDMNFGNIAVSSSGTVLLSPDGSRSVSSGGLTLPSSNPGTVSAAQFTVTGSADFAYAITLPSSIILTHSNGTDMLQASMFTSSTGGHTGKLDNSGTQVLSIGATLFVQSDQPIGEYTNTGFYITVNYN